VAATYLSNAALAAKVDNLIQRWSVREDEYQAWVGGAANGGPNADGKFPVTDPEGTVHMIESPAALAAMVTGPAGSVNAALAAALVARDAAQAAAGGVDAQVAAAVAAKDDARSARDLALTYRDQSASNASNANSRATAAETARAAAELARNDAEAAKTDLVEAREAAEAAAGSAGTSRDLAHGYMEAAQAAAGSSGGIKQVTSQMVTDALTYTPYPNTNPSGYITGINGTMVVNALGYQPPAQGWAVSFNDITTTRGDGTGVIYLGRGDRYVYFDGGNYIMPGGQIFANGAQVMTHTNDGSGSAYDADMVDGYHADAFLQRGTDVWQTSQDGKPRLYFAGNGPTYAKVVGTYRWQNQGNADVTTIDEGGNFYTSGDITAFSDARLKSNVRVIEGALGIVEGMRGVRYVKDGRESIGVIAQEVREVLPELVHEAHDDRKTLSVAYGNIVGVLIEAIKELRAEVRELKEQLA
jgi:hypothetical protein